MTFLQSAKQPFKRIMVPLDGSFFSEQAIPFAKAIAGSDAELLLMQVAPAGKAVYTVRGRLIVSEEEMTRARVDESDTSLAHACQDWLSDRPHVRTMTAIGDAAEKIVQTAYREKADLIVMASHGYGGVLRWVIGSVADRVARTSQIPVLVMRPTPGEYDKESAPQIGRIVVPFDGSSLATQAFPIAARLARGLGIPVQMVKVSGLSKTFESSMFYGVPLSPDLYEEVLRDTKSDDEKQLETAADRLRQAGVSVDTLMIEGPVADAIASITIPTDLIVMTSHGRGGLRRMVLGSVAEKLVRQGPVPVMVVPARVADDVRDYADEPIAGRAPQVAVGH